MKEYQDRTHSLACVSDTAQSIVEAEHYMIRRRQMQTLDAPRHLTCEDHLLTINKRMETKDMQQVGYHLNSELLLSVRQ